MPRSCPPLRPDRVGWHGRRVRTRLRLILERVFWFVNGGMSGVIVGGWRFHAPHLGSGLRREDGGGVGDDRGLRAVPRPTPGLRPSPEYLCLIVKGFQVAGA